MTSYSTALPNVIYTGFDPTSNSLHIGNLLVLNSLLRSSLFGCFPIALIGEATATIGDPSGHRTDRIQLPREIIHENAKALTSQVENIASNASSLYGRNIVIDIQNNAKWYKEAKILDFFEAAKRFRVSEILRSGPVKSRLESGNTMSYAEFSYQILQAMDWLKLYEKRNCLCQIGGTDQFGNFKAGFEHIRAKTDRLSIALCLPILTDGYGQKLGKSSTQMDGTTFWLDASKTSAFSFYQYLRQLHDDVAQQFLIYFSLRDIEEIEEIVEIHQKNLGKWIAQTHLADELTALIHGNEGLKMAKKCSDILFNDSFRELEKLNPEEVKRLFGMASTQTIDKNLVSTLGELAELTRRGGSQSMKTGALKINGVKKTNPEEKLVLGNIIVGQFTVVCWGKRKFSLIKWR